MRNKDRNGGSERGKAIQKKSKRQKKNNDRMTQGPLLRNRRIKSSGTGAKLPGEGKKDGREGC